MMIPDPTFIYHFTHINNLPLILTGDGLLTYRAARHCQPLLVVLPG